uniref:Uncharacterized protein n=1 Tax=Schistosoma japonicum TaxID=6182 RepID=Q5C5R0_SCHJA|nr:unknown [Schistosoma japonicum]
MIASTNIAFASFHLFLFSRLVLCNFSIEFRLKFSSCSFHSYTMCIIIR